MMINAALYISKATRDFSHTDIQALVELAIKKNKQMELTGFIRFKNGYFIQYIEGSYDAIQEMKTTLDKDKRHSILMWLEDVLPVRKFTNWAMREVEEPVLESLDVSSFIFDELEEFSHLVDISKQAQQLLWSDVGVIAKHHDSLMGA